VTEQVIAEVVVGALTGFGAAVVVDFAAFKKFQTWDEFATYSWGVASFRWFQGIVVGALGGPVANTLLDIVRQAMA
jgi:hypothetical protein